MRIVLFIVTLGVLGCGDGSGGSDAGAPCAVDADCVPSGQCLSAVCEDGTCAERADLAGQPCSLEDGGAGECRGDTPGTCQPLGP
jgi:sulfatase modifying factor 1